MITLSVERPEDIDAIREVTTAAFKGMAHSSGTEAAIIDALRTAGALTLSLVALDSDNGEIVGHLAFSPVTIQSGIPGWFGLGPVSVRPGRQGLGIGKQMIESGLAQLREQGASGCVVLGDPHFYIRFGFASDPALRYAGAPPEYFQRIVFKEKPPIGAVAYHRGFDAG